MSNQAVILDTGGTIETFFSTGRPATCTVTLYTDRGAAKVDAASATVDPVSTSISGAHSAGATTINVTSSTSIVAGGRYIVGATSSTAPLEVVAIKSITATVAELMAPLAYAHNAGDTFAGGRVYYTVTSGDADALWWDGYAVFTPASGDPITEAVECVKRKIPEQLINKADVLMVYPKGQKMLDAEVDLARALRLARDKFLRDIGGKFRANTLLGADDLKWGASLCFWLMRGPSMGDDWADNIERIKEMYEAELSKLAAQLPVDTDQDGITSGPSDGGYTTGRVDRA